MLITAIIFLIVGFALNLWIFIKLVDATWEYLATWIATSVYLVGISKEFLNVTDGNIAIGIIIYTALVVIAFFIKHRKKGSDDKP